MKPRRFVVATNNPGKLEELRRLLAPLGMEPVSQSEFGLPPAPEDAPTFVENALGKARAAALATGLPALADDSGLEVDALGGEPGIHSARYAGRHGDDAANIERLLAELAQRPGEPRTARFRCVAVYLPHAGHPAPVIGEGTWAGEITEAPRGTGGFGYDPVFRLPDRGITAAELEPAEKDRLSHRGRALAVLVRQLRESGAGERRA